MHFEAGGPSDPSIQLLVDLISSANDTCILHGICDFLGQINKGENRQNTASVVTYSKSLGTCPFVSSTCCRRALRLCLVSGGTPLSTSINS